MGVAEGTVHIKDACIALCLAAASVEIAAGRSTQVRVDATRQREAVAHYRAGQDFLHWEQLDEAIKEFQTAVSLDPMLALAHYSLGQTEMKLKQYREAIAAFLACRQAFQNLQSLASKEQASSEQLRDDEIRELQDSIRRIQSGQIKLGGQPEIFKLEARIAELERMKMRGLAADQVPSAVSLALGSAYFRTGELGDAEREYTAAIRVNPKFGEAHNNLAVVYMMTNRLAEAEREVKLAEAAGYQVAQGLKDEIKKKKGGGQ
jgi:tetratricopeptide (TPR) repeat protein